MVTYKFYDREPTISLLSASISLSFKVRVARSTESTGVVPSLLSLRVITKDCFDCKVSTASFPHAYAKVRST